MKKEIDVIENEDGSTQIEIPVPSFTEFNVEDMDVEGFFNFDEMRKSLEHTKNGFTVHPYPNEDFTPISVHATLEMWKIEISYHCANDDMDCIIDIYAKALDRIDTVVKDRLGRKWGLYLMPDGYNLAIIHNYEIMMKEYNKLVAIDIKNEKAKQKHKDVRKAAANALLSSNIKRRK